MHKFLVNFLCLFIFDKETRHKLRNNLAKPKKIVSIKLNKKNLLSRNIKPVNNKILLIGYNNFLKNNAGCNAYVFNIVKLLKTMGFKMDFISSENFAWNEEEREFDDFEKLNEKYKMIDRTFLLAYSKEKVFKKYKYSNSTSKWFDDRFVSLFQKIISENEYGYILSNYINFSDLFRFTDLNPNTKIINIFHDCNTMQMFFRFNNYSDIGMFFEEEVKLLQYYDDILNISYDEKILFEKFYPDKKFHWLPFFSESKNISSCEKDIDLLFVGHCNMYNYNSILWFYNNVFPKLKSVKLVVCGKVSKMIRVNNPSIYHQMEKDNITFYDYVENLDDLYFKTKIAIVPMFGGTGLKVKTVTAMSYGIPVCGTMSACDGFPDKTENGCLLATNASEFANNINKLLSDKEFYNQVSIKEKNYFKKHFSVESAKKVLKEVFDG